MPKASRIESIEIKPLGVNSYGYLGKRGRTIRIKRRRKTACSFRNQRISRSEKTCRNSSSEYYEKNSKFLFFASVSKKEVMSGDIEISTTFCMKNGNRKVRNYTLRSKKAKNFMINCMRQENLKRISMLSIREIIMILKK